MVRYILILSAFVLISCDSKTGSEPEQGSKVVMTKDSQADMTAEEVLEDLLAGNKRFMDHALLDRDHLSQLTKLNNAQFPKAVVLSCIDSRVPVELIFDQGIGDLFVIRVAGNIENNHNLASLEYGCAVAGAKLIIVLGHENCGAMKSAVKGVDMGNITELLTHFQPAINRHPEFKGIRTFKNPDFMELTTKENAILTVQDIREYSPVLREMEEEGKVVLVAAYFDLDLGEVVILEK